MCVCVCVYFAVSGVLAVSQGLVSTSMAETGASLQNTNNELVKSIEELREKREECDRAISKEEEGKGPHRA